MTRGESFMVPADGGRTTLIPMNKEDERFIRACRLSSMGRAMVIGAGVPQEVLPPNTTAQRAATRYRNRSASVLVSISERTGIDKSELIAYLQHAIVSFSRVRINKRFAVEMEYERTALITFPEQ